MAAATASRNKLIENITKYAKAASSMELAALLFMIYLLFKAYAPSVFPAAVPSTSSPLAL